MTPTARKSRRVGFLQDENPPRNRGKYFHRIYFAKPTKSFPRKIKLKSPTGQNFSVRYNPTVQSEKILSQDFFAKHKKSFSLKDETQKHNQAENDPDPQE